MDSEAIQRPASDLDEAVIRVADAPHVAISGLQISVFGEGSTGVLRRSVSRATIQNIRISHLGIGVDVVPVGGEKLILWEHRVGATDTGVGIRVVGNTDAELAANEVAHKAVGAAVTGNRSVSNVAGSFGPTLACR